MRSGSAPLVGFNIIMSLSTKLHTFLEFLRAPIRLSHETAAMHASLRRLSQITGKLCESQLRASLPVDHLARNGYSVYSQNDEDGILMEIFRRVGSTNRSFVEIGTGDGMQCNTTHLLLQGWSGCWIEIDRDACSRAGEIFAQQISACQLTCHCQRVTAENINSLLGSYDGPNEPDLLSIDIDGNDYWVWKAIDQVKPRVVVIEYNAGFGPDLDWVMDYNAEASWDGSRRQGASLTALEHLGTQKGYQLVGCNLFGVNAFFVRENAIGNAFVGPFTTRHHYMPPLYSPPDYHWPMFRGHDPSAREISGMSRVR